MLTIDANRFEASPGVDAKPSQVIATLTQDEVDLTRKIFARVDPTEAVTSRLSDHGHFVDPSASSDPSRKRSSARKLSSSSTVSRAS